MILHLLRMRRNVNRNVFNDRKNVSATTAQRPWLCQNALCRISYCGTSLFKRRLFSINSITHKLIEPDIYLTQNSMSLYFSNKYSADKIQSRMSAGSLPYLATYLTISTPQSASLQITMSYTEKLTISQAHRNYRKI